MRIFIAFLFCSILTTSIFAQEKEVGVFVGATAYQGDLVEKLFDFNELSVGYGAFYRFYTNPKFSFRLGVTAGTFTGDDANATPMRANRGFSMKSSIIDATAIVEWNILGINIYGPSAYNHNRFSPYLMLGVGGAMFNPEVTATNNELQPLDADKEYASYSMVIPMGVGFRYATDKITIGIEGILRAGLTDYIDGISKSGDPDHNDWYGFYGINAAYRIGNVSPSSKPMDETPKELEEFESTDESEDFDSDN